MIRIRGFSNEVCAAVVDRVVVHGRTMRESGLRFSVSSIVRTFRDENRYHTMELNFSVLYVPLNYKHYRSRSRQYKNMT